MVSPPVTQDPVAVVGLEDLRDFSLAACASAGFAAADASDLTESLLGAALRSLPGQGQGIQSLAKYIERCRAGVIDPTAQPTEVRGDGPVRLLDARRAHGAVAATQAMRLAITLAREHGIGAVGVRDSTHLGAAGLYAEHAAAQNCIGLVFTNAGPEIAPWGGTEPTVGTNPWAVAAPTRQGWPLVLDMANSTSGKGMVRWHQLIGSPIPDDWALTVEGRHTTDPAAALLGPLFPLGGAKGYAMALMVDILTGALTGSAVGRDCFGEGHQDVGHLLIAIRIEALIDLEVFLDRVEDLITQVRSSPAAADAPEARMLVPGELEYERRMGRMRDGVPIPVDRLEQLLALGDELDLDAEVVAPLRGARP
jgi:LDH2 family malate/lactate/ureidoglycolate dehydrogenase